MLRLSSPRPTCLYSSNFLLRKSRNLSQSQVSMISSTGASSFPKPINSAARNSTKLQIYFSTDNTICHLQFRPRNLSWVACHCRPGFLMPIEAQPGRLPLRVAESLKFKIKPNRIWAGNWTQREREIIVSSSYHHLLLERWPKDTVRLDVVVQESRCLLAAW